MAQGERAARLNKVEDRVQREICWKAEEQRHRRALDDAFDGFEIPHSRPLPQRLEGYGRTPQYDTARDSYRG